MREEKKKQEKIEGAGMVNMEGLNNMPGIFHATNFENLTPKSEASYLLKGNEHLGIRVATTDKKEAKVIQDFINLVFIDGDNEKIKKKLSINLCLKLYNFILEAGKYMDNEVLITLPAKDDRNRIIINIIKSKYAQ
jgi:hypothetical protein